MTEESVTPENPSASLEEALKKYDLSLSPKKIRLLEQYCEELWTWNEKINLTRHTDYDKFVARDVIDSVHLAALLQKGEHVLDVGTGGGVPGIILAILRPDLTVELCDSTGKKAKAVGEILDRLGLKLNVWYAKAEELLKVHRFHTLVVRAVSRMEKLLQMVAPRWFAFDRMLMVKGSHWVEERGEARHLGRLNNVALRKLDEYTVAGEDHASVILQVCRKERYKEITQRETDLLEGKPIAKITETIAVDNFVPRPGPKKAAGGVRRKGTGRSFTGRSSDKAGRDSDSSKPPRKRSVKGTRSDSKTYSSDGTGRATPRKKAVRKKSSTGGQSSRPDDSSDTPKKRRGKGWVE